MTDADIEATKAPLMDHIIELRSRLIRALATFLVLFVVCFFFAKTFYNVLVLPYTKVAGPDARLIYTAPQEYFFTQIKVAFFAAAYLACPVIFAQIYAFVAPGLRGRDPGGGVDGAAPRGRGQIGLKAVSLRSGRAIVELVPPYRVPMAVPADPC